MSYMPSPYRSTYNRSARGFQTPDAAWMENEQLKGEQCLFWGRKQQHDSDHKLHRGLTVRVGPSMLTFQDNVGDFKLNFRKRHMKAHTMKSSNCTKKSSSDGRDPQ